jgi:hypothetical protein
MFSVQYSQTLVLCVYCFSKDMLYEEVIKRFAWSIIIELLIHGICRGVLILQSMSVVAFKFDRSWKIIYSKHILKQHYYIIYSSLIKLKTLRQHVWTVSIITLPNVDYCNIFCTKTIPCHKQKILSLLLTGWHLNAPFWIFI